MDSRLKDRLTKWHDRIEKLKEVELQCFELEGSEKSFYGELYLKTEGTVAEREARVYASQEWKDFKAGLQAAKSLYNHERRLLELSQNAFNAEYLTMKVEADAIRRAG